MLWDLFRIMKQTISIIPSHFCIWGKMTSGPLLYTYSNPEAPLLTFYHPHSIFKFFCSIRIPPPPCNHLQADTNVVQTVFYTTTRARTLYTWNLWFVLLFAYILMTFQIIVSSDYNCLPGQIKMHIFRQYLKTFKSFYFYVLWSLCKDRPSSSPLATLLQK